MSKDSKLDEFLESHPETRYIDALFVDLCGIIRGKRYPVDDAPKIFHGGVQLPESVYVLDVTGFCPDAKGRGFSDGDPDAIARPVADTLAPVPWAAAPTAQVLMNLHGEDGTPSPIDPRHIAAKTVRRLADLGLTPAVAFELEFFLLDRERDANGRPQAAVSTLTGARATTTQVYGMAEVDEFGDFFAAVDEACARQNLPATAATSEFAAGQYEINLNHRADALRAADDCALLRYAIKSIARRHGMEATFMSKPFADRAGNGMHLHISLLDADGRNVFDDGSDAGSPRLRHALGGLLTTMPDAMSIFAPNINAFRRFEPDQYVPVNANWAFNNRSSALRIPAGDSSNRRIEHRVPGADANPYLVLATVLAGIHKGIVDNIEPDPPATGNAGAEMAGDIPFTLPAALDRLDESDALKDYLGAGYVSLYTETKRQELARFMERISSREYEWYL